MEFSSISILLVMAAVFGVLAKMIKQPLLVGYLLAGGVASYFGFFSGGEFESLGKIGVALLLFLVGLEIDLKEIPTIGKVVLITGLGQIGFTSLFGFLISRGLGYPVVTSLYIAVALTFSSTIIIIKLLSEKRDLDSLYGKISVGFLLVQDLVAVLILMFLAGFRTGNVSVLSTLFILVKAMGLFALTWYLSKKILPTIFEKIVGHSHELLFVVSIAWALGVSAFVGGPLGFSFEIGGFLAGLSLSNISEHLGVANKTRPLRDFFLTIFFLSLGSQLVIGDIGSVIVPALIFSAFVLIGNPIIVMSLLGMLGYKKRTSFLASVTVAQISEFSFILMAMGLTLGHVQGSVVSTIILVGAITMTISTYLITGAEKIYPKIKAWLSVFEKHNISEGAYLQSEENLENHIVLVGCDRTGKRLLPFFKNKGHNLLVVDHDPNVFKRLSADKIKVILGDATDMEILHLLNIKKAKMLICTVSSISQNLSILEYVKFIKSNATFIGSAQTREDAMRLYEKGADFVLVPEVLAGEFLRHVFLSHGIALERFKKMGKSHFNRLMYAKI